jgi:hypothetical protein
VQVRLKPRPHVPQFYLVTLCASFRTYLLNRRFNVVCYGFHDQTTLFELGHQAISGRSCTSDSDIVY